MTEEAMNELISVTDIQVMAAAVAKSGLFGIKTPDQALALMLVAQAEGMHPATAARDYHVIQGRPALKADAMLARFQNAGGRVQWGEYTDKKVVGTFSHPAGGSVEISWTLEQAKAIGLTGKDNWKHYPRAMLRARVISEGIRTVYPGIVVGVYTPEEVQDFEQPKEKVINPVANALGDWGEQHPHEMDELRELAAVLVQMVEIDGNSLGAFEHVVSQNLDNEQKLALWSILSVNSKTRSALKKEEKARAQSTVVEVVES
jgi:hypothetical protein